MHDENLDVFLAHYGVKGMKWGVIRERSGGSGRKGAGSLKSSSSDAYGAAIDKYYAGRSKESLQREGAKKLKEQANQVFPSVKSGVQNHRNKKADGLDASNRELDAKAKSLRDQIAKTDSTLKGKLQRRSLNSELKSVEAAREFQTKTSKQLREGKLTNNEKVLIATGVAATVGILALYGANKYNKNQQDQFEDLLAGFKRKSQITPRQFQRQNKELLDRNKSQTASQWETLFGKAPEFRDPTGIHPELGGPNAGGFFTGLSSKKALDRPEFTIPKTTVFQRLSDHPETGKGYDKGAYSTFLSNDKHIYGASGEFGGKKYRVNYQPAADVRVPSTRTVLEALRVSESKRTGKSMSEEQAFSLYHSLSGGSWKSPPAEGLFAQLKKTGYSAIVDDMDAGYLGDLPVVFFGEAKNVTATPRSTDDRKNDERSILPTIKQYA